MKYRLSVFNSLSVLFICVGCWLLLTYKGTDPEGIGTVLTMIAFFVPAVLLTVDYLLQLSFSSNAKLLLVEFSPIVVLAMFLVYDQRSKNIIIPNNFVGTVILVYGVEGASALPKHFWNLKYDLYAPKSGVILTSSSRIVDFNRTLILSEVHERIDRISDSTARYSSEYGPYELPCGERTFIYYKWVIGRHSHAGYSVYIDTTINRTLRESICN